MSPSEQEPLFSMTRGSWPETENPRDDICRYNALALRGAMLLSVNEHLANCGEKL